jgi:hypothetical protein
MPLQQQQQQVMTGQMNHDNNSDDDDDALTLSSNQLANELRELYDLPVINRQDIQGQEEHLLLLSNNIITNLNGFLKDYSSDLEENPIDVIKDCGRENIS